MISNHLIRNANRHHWQPRVEPEPELEWANRRSLTSRPDATALPPTVFKSGKQGSGLPSASTFSDPQALL